jgi:MoxR-like ATPase
MAETGGPPALQDHGPGLRSSARRLGHRATWVRDWGGLHALPARSDLPPLGGWLREAEGRDVLLGNRNIPSGPQRFAFAESDDACSSHSVVAVMARAFPEFHMSQVLYGARLDSIRMTKTLEHLFETNLRLQEAGENGVPICIWGTHGLGKTSSVKDFAKKRGWKIAYCAPAQFEEMGDLHGLPTRVDPDANVHGDERTVFLPPDWVPTEEGPGILMIDDMNRADDRILRGIMQLLQEFEMFSWKLPHKWQIVCTCNPEGGDYGVTPMDDAMITRMLHLTLVFDVKAWAAWASEAGVDPRGIAFVLAYPELVNDRRTTPRSLTQFFDQIRYIPDLAAELDLVSVLAQSALDEATVGAFITFAQQDVKRLITPEEVLDAEDFAVPAARIKDVASDGGGGRRTDVLSILCTRLHLHVARKDYTPGPRHATNLVAFLLLPILPNDLRFALHRDCMAVGPSLRELLRDKRLAELLLKSM